MENLQDEYMNDVEDEQPAPRRRCGPSRMYYAIMAFLFAILLLIAVISLGTFGSKHAEVRQVAKDQGAPASCILFGKKLGEENQLGDAGFCAFVLWGQVSIAIVFLVWLIFSVVLTIIGPKVISLLRVLDLAMCIISGIVSFGVSILLHVGLEQTCDAFTTPDNDICKAEKVLKNVEFFGEINVAKSTSWIISIVFILFSLVFCLLMVIFCIRCSKKRATNRDYAYVDEEDFAADDDDDEPLQPA